MCDSPGAVRLCDTQIEALSAFESHHSMPYLISKVKYHPIIMSAQTDSLATVMKNTSMQVGVNTTLKDIHNVNLSIFTITDTYDRQLTVLIPQVRCPSPFLMTSMTFPLLVSLTCCDYMVNYIIQLIMEDSL